MSISTVTHVDSIDALESHKLAHLEARLIATFSPPLRPEEVRHCLIDCVARYESARVRQYLPLLVERDATERLREMSRRDRLRTAPHVLGGGQRSTDEPDDPGVRRTNLNGPLDARIA